MAKFRWVAEFLAGSGGFVEKVEVVGAWFGSMDKAKEDAALNAEKEVWDYPASRGIILKLMVEDNFGKITELKNALNQKVCRDY